jgi:CheY-like chemotaxis protein
MSATHRRILYIEDNPDNRMLVKRILEAEGYTLVEASNAHDGLAPGAGRSAGPGADGH